MRDQTWIRAHEESESVTTILICEEESFPYLARLGDVLELQFRVHLKPNKELKYLNQGSAHTKATFKTISNGVLRRLTLLTKVNEYNKDTTYAR